MELPEGKHYLIEVSSGFINLYFNGEGIYSLSLMRRGGSNAVKPAVADRVELYWPELEEEIKAYFYGRPIKGDYPLIMSGYSAWTRKVLQLTREIPYGKTMTYKQLADKAGVPGGSRAVGQALARNRTPLLIPCHRVVGQNNQPGGFTAGLDWKKELLELEGFAFRM